MTAKRDLKKLVRERQAQTGESYVTALRQVRAQRVDDAVSEGPISVVELVDLTEVGAPLGYKCRIHITPTLVARVDAAAVLTRFRDMLIATGRDRELDLMRDVVLRGRPSHLERRRPAVSAVHDFLARAHAGLGGVSSNGRVIAMNVDSKSGALMALFAVTIALPGLPSKGPSLGLSEVPELGDTSLDWAVLPW